MFKLSEISSFLNGRLVGSDCNHIAGVTTDSRNAQPGQLFFALRGKNFDGHDFAREAYVKTQTAVVVEREITGVNQQIIVANTLNALGNLAHHYRKHFKPLVIGITGTNGKTTTKNIIGGILKRKNKTIMTEGTMNNQIGLPLTLLKLDSDACYCVLEMGTNQPGEIDYLCKIAQPHLGVLTNIGYAHLAGFRTHKDLVKEKLTIIDRLPPDGTAIVNAKIKGFWANRKVVTFSLNRNAHYYPTRISIRENGSSFFINKKLYHTNLLGRTNVENIVCAIATTSVLNINYDTQREVIETIQPEPMRLEPIRINNTIIVNDCYNANPNSMKEALRFIAPLKRRKVAVLGDMLELGKAAKQLHKNVGDFARKRVDLLITVGEMAQLYQGVHFTQHSQAVDYIVNNIKDGDVILFKASRLLGMEKIIQPVLDSLRKPGGA